MFLKSKDILAEWRLLSDDRYVILLNDTPIGHYKIGDQARREQIVQEVQDLLEKGCHVKGIERTMSLL